MIEITHNGRVFRIVWNERRAPVAAGTVQTVVPVR
jgi:hypothetical protein